MTNYECCNQTFLHDFEIFMCTQIKLYLVAKIEEVANKALEPEIKGFPSFLGKHQKIFPEKFKTLM